HHVGGRAAGLGQHLFEVAEALRRLCGETARPDALSFVVPGDLARAVADGAAAALGRVREAVGDGVVHRRAIDGLARHGSPPPLGSSRPGIARASTLEAAGSTDQRLTSATPTAATAMPRTPIRPSVSPNSGHAMSAVTGGTR